MKNRTFDLNDTLFDQLERISNPDLTGDALSAEIQRAGAVCSLADRVNANHRTIIEAVKVADAAGITIRQPPLVEFLENKRAEEPRRIDNGRASRR